MAMSTRLMMRQGQSLVMTPQLLQAIKLLQFSNLELAAFLQEEIERNPLLEAHDEAPPPIAAEATPTAEAFNFAQDSAGLSATGWTGAGGGVDPAAPDLEA